MDNSLLVANGAKSSVNFGSVSAVDPASGKTCTLYIQKVRLDAVAKQGPIQLHTLAYLVPFAVQNPTAVYEGVREDRTNRSRCYVAKPDFRFVGQDGHRVPAVPMRVFLVFADADCVIYNWRWEQCDPGDPTLPEGHSTRFDRRLL